MRRFAAQHFLPGEGGHIELVPGQVHREGRRGGIANRQAGAVVGNPVAIGNAHARGGAIPGKHDIVVEIDRSEIDDLAIIGGFDVCVDLELFHDIRDPTRAKAFPGQHLDLALAQKRPQRHLDRTGIRRGNNADLVIGGDAQHLTRAFDRGLQLVLANGGTVAAAQRGIGELFERECGGFGAGARGKTRICRPRCRLLSSHQCYPYR